ncbi:uncharacterized protein jeb [Venturia canescens]|uniref:uncharacterized protein jeb n=1 Tax=Venturia canescens TaxID=32260 RepID=UPI001C9D1368|nr:uncharacterized protein LOC122413717 [Venturia canescens]XP_043280190.1 uncharacterized protein LOC122413717 [Venturia canescens]XP_043280191.1 uncharacterized protein LOC122413717 [Venturia canescens]
MSSQMFWLLSYVSLGLALSLGNRPTGMHGTSSSSSASSSSSSSSSSSQQQKPQSTSSGQGFKSRQENRLTRVDEESKSLQSMATVSHLLEFENSGSHRYEEQLPLVGFNQQSNFQRFEDKRDRRIEQEEGEEQEEEQEEDDDDDDDNERERRGKEKEKDRKVRNAREKGFLDEFAIAVLDTLYPRNRDLLVSGKPPNIKDRSDDILRLMIPNYHDQMNLHAPPRLSLNGRRNGPELTRKYAKLPIEVVYRADRTIPAEAPVTWNAPRVFSDRPEAPFFSYRDHDFSKDLRNPADWINAESNEISNFLTRIDHSTTKRRDSAVDDRWLNNDNFLRKRNDARSKSSNSRATPSGWSGSGPQSQSGPPTGPGASIASQFLLRSARGNRQYDVPQIECPASEDGMERFACPTPDRMGRYRCIDDHVLCDGFIDCPTAEDEDRQACMFYKTTKAHLDVLADALLRWARGR